MSDPQQPPAQQPQWSPPPQQPAGWGGGGGAMGPARPTGVTLAAIYLIVVGVLVALAGACVAGLSGLLGQAGAQQGVDLGPIAALGATAGIIVIVIGILSIAAGWGSLQGRNWARWLGIVISVLAVVFGVWGIIQSGNISANITTIVVSVLYALTAWALWANGAWFAARR